MDDKFSGVLSVIQVIVIILIMIICLPNYIQTTNKQSEFFNDEVLRISSFYNLDEETSSGIVRVAERYLFNKGKFVKVDGVSFDVDTGVLYTSTNGYQGRTALYNPDGSLSTYKYYEIFLEVVKSLKESGLYG